MEKTRKKLWIAFAGIFAVIACFLLFNPNTVKNTYAAADANITNQTGLGLGINVVTAESFNDFKLSYMVFDDEALQALPKSSVDLNNSQSYMYSTIDERSLIAQFSFDLGNSVSAGALVMKLTSDHIVTNIIICWSITSNAIGSASIIILTRIHTPIVIRMLF